MQATAAPSNSTITSADIQRYHVAMWTAIGLAVVVIIGASRVILRPPSVNIGCFAAIYGIACMENRKDSLLYGNFNPNWEDRKKK